MLSEDRHHLKLESAADDSSESEGEAEPSKSFHRCFSTNRNIKSSVCTKESYLTKHTSSFQRWRRRYFRLKGRTLYYAKDNKSVIFEEISLTDLSVAECSTKNVNHSFQIITPFQSLVLCAESRREMEEWLTALKAVANKEFYDSADHHDFLSGQHNWYASSHARPTYCNVCREALSGVTSHGLSCEVCKFKAHKRCAAKAINNCKWTTLASVGKDIIEDEDGVIAMPHQWMEGNLPVSAKCAVCDKTCGSVLRLQDWRCLWCRATVHTACRPQLAVKCPLGPCKVSIIPPSALHSIGTDEAWEVVRPQGCSPLLVFVNSKSGDNQGVKFLRRFKQLLNPAQVFDLMNGGPSLGLRLFRHFDPFRVLVCSGDGSVGWVLSEIDKLHMDKQCQVGVMPLGTGNDLARVLGWGSVCDDDTHLPQLLERYEKASVKMLDRWSIMTTEKPLSRKVVLPCEPITAFEDSVASHLSKILQSDQHAAVISSAKVLCETIKDFISKMGSLSSEMETQNQGEDSINHKCNILDEKLALLLATLNQEAAAVSSPTPSPPAEDEESEDIEGATSDISHVKSSKDSLAGSKTPQRQRRPRKRVAFIQRDALMSRANSLKKAVRQIVEQVDRLLDEQNTQTQSRSARSLSVETNQTVSSSENKFQPEASNKKPAMSWLNVSSATCEHSSDSSNSPSPIPVLPSLTTNFPLLPPSPMKYQHPVQSHYLKMQPTNSTPKTSIVICQDSLESEGDEDREALLSLQAKLHAISPVQESESRISAEFDFSALALPVPLEFADTDSLKDIEVEILDEEEAPTPTRERHFSFDCMDNEEPDEIEVKPILDPGSQTRTPEGKLAPVAVFVEGPSSDDADSSTDKCPEEEVEAGTTNEEKLTEDDGAESALAKLGERIVEGAEEPAVPVKNSPVRATKVDQSEASPSRWHATSATTLRSTDCLRLDSPTKLLQPSPTATRRISSGSMLRSLHGGAPATPPAISAGTTYSYNLLEAEKEPVEKEKEKEMSITAVKKRKMPIINPLVSLPMFPNVEGGMKGLISKVLLANADALCAAASPLMDVEHDSELFEEKCVMNSYFGIGIDAKITLDFHLKREEHPEKCRSRAKNYMWYGVLGSKEWLQKTYKNLEQKVLLECDGTPITLPSLQGVVVLNIPSFMGGTNFWGGSKEDDCFLAQSFDDRILEVVAVFGSVQMAASRIINLQHHRIAQCHSVKITILGDEGVPVQVDGEAWVQSPGVIRIVHKNRMQMLSRNRALERSLEAWQEKQRYQSVASGKLSQSTALTDEENQVLIGFLEAITALVRHVRLLAISQPEMDQDLYHLATQASALLDKMHPEGKIVEGPILRVHLTDLVHIARQLQHETCQFLRDKAPSLKLRPNQEEKLASSLAQVDSELRKCTEIGGLTHFITTDDAHEKKSRGARSSGLFKLKFRRPEPRSRSQCSRPPPSDSSSSSVHLWGNEEVSAWLENLQLGEYRENFLRHDIRGSELLSLDRRDLKELGINKLGHIKRIQQAIWDMKEASKQ